MGLLKAVAQEVQGFAIATSHTTATGGSWAATLAQSSRANVGDAYGTAAHGGLLHVPRLLAQPTAALGGAPQRLSDSFAVTGGSGALGSYVALWLMQCGASSVHLCSRSGGVLGIVQQQVAPDMVLAVHKVDAALQSDLAGLLGAFRVAPLAGTIHAGGILADATLAKQTLAGLRQVGAKALHDSLG